MPHSASRVKDQAVIARRKVLCKREQRRAGVPAVVVKIRGEYYQTRQRSTEKTTWLGDRFRVLAGAEKQDAIAQLQPSFRPGVTVRHKILGKVGKLVSVSRGMSDGSDKWIVRWDGAKSPAGPYVERNLVIV